MIKKRYLTVLILGLFLLPAQVFATGKKETLVLGMMPAINSIPLIIAEHEGYFEEEGISVSLTMFKSQMYRESALQTGSIDGTISDLMNAINAVSEGFPLQVASYTDGDFALLASPQGRLRRIEDWSNPEIREVKTGLLENSIVYYVTERMLGKLSQDPKKINLVSTLVVTARVEMLLSGQIDAACLPEPIATVAEQAGAIRLCDTSLLNATPGVMLFSEKALKEKGAAVKAFYRAYNRAVADLNSGYEEYREVIVEKGEFPPVIKDTLTLPRFSPARVPTREEVADVINWMMEKGLITKTLEYSILVNPGFLPQ